MRKRVVRILDVPDSGVLTALCVLASAFGLGGIVGLLVASRVAGGGQTTLSSYIEGYLAAAQLRTADSPGLGTVVLEMVRWPFLAFLLGFMAIGVAGLPVLFAVRGFLLSFAIASFVNMFGGAGCLLAFFSFGLTGMLAVPTLFVLGVQSFHMARRRLLNTGGGKGGLSPGGQYVVRCGLCLGALMLCVAVEYWVVPDLLRSVAPLF